jgi:hypothetical protein
MTAGNPKHAENLEALPKRGIIVGGYAGDYADREMPRYFTILFVDGGGVWDETIHESERNRRYGCQSPFLAAALPQGLKLTEEIVEQLTEIALRYVPELKGREADAWGSYNLWELQEDFERELSEFNNLNGDAYEWEQDETNT